MMTDNSFQDIVPPNRRTIRNVTNQHVHTGRPSMKEDEPLLYESPRSPRSSRIGLWFIAGVAVIIFALSFSLLFSGAKVEIVPKQRTVLLDGVFEALNDKDITSALGYSVMTIEKVGSKDILATGREDVQIKASGDLVIFNDFNSSSQRLIKNTRFETPDGLIYRINKSVVVPGRTSEEEAVVPGSVRVTVYADDYGDEYNIGLSDFTIPGFKGSPRFEKFYARSATAMSGGFVGVKLVADEVEVERARSGVQEDLQKQLLNEAFSQKPEEFLLYEDAVFVVFESLPDEEKGDSVEVRGRAILYGVLFDSSDLSGHIAENTVADFDDSDVEVANISELQFAIVDKENSKPWQDDSLSFTLKGSAHIVWLFDESALKGDLAGRSKDALSTVLSGYPSIERAEVILRPFWKRSFPENIKKIKVEKTLE